MSPRPPRPRAHALRRRTLSLLATGASSALVIGLLPSTASAVPPCVDGVCTASFADTGSLQHFTVPDGVTTLTAVVSGAAAGANGGLGGRTLANLPVTPGTDLTLLVGKTADGLAGGFGGGGAGGQGLRLLGDDGLGGGGGSFLFDAQDHLLAAAGGGGGAGVGTVGGAGGGAGSLALPGAFSGVVGGGGPGTLEANGLGGVIGQVSGVPNLGVPGTGAVSTPLSVPLGGAGGLGSNGAGGGGGGYHAGGGGGAVDTGLSLLASGAGGGGAGYAEQTATGVVGSTGVQPGGGLITLTWDLVKQGLQFSTLPGPDLAVGDVYDIDGLSTTSSLPLAFSLDPSTTTGDACSIDGQTVTLLHTGTCGIALEQVADLTHAFTRIVQTFPVNPATQNITFPTLPSPVDVLTTLPLVAQGGGSTAPVVFELAPATTAGACLINGTTLSLTGAGTCAVRATQAGDADHLPAPPVTQDVLVRALATSTGLSLSTSSTVYGAPVDVSATVTGALTPGTVRFRVDDHAVGSAVPVGPDGKATLTDLFATGSYPGVGSHLVSADFTPLDLAVFDTSHVELPLVVSKADTTTRLTVGTSRLSADVTPVAPGRGDPLGQVTFRVGDVAVGSAQVVQGKAVLDYTLPAGSTAKVSVLYTGDLHFLGSTDSTPGPNPVITAKVTSTVEKSASGWYRKPVTVSFECSTTGAPLATDCPSPITLSNDGGGQSVFRTIRATDGGIATATVLGINIDQAAPTPEILGAKAGDRFFATAPVATCSSTDALSGIASCEATSKKKGSKVTYTVTAEDGAGNTASAIFAVDVYKYGISNAPYSDGAYTVQVDSGYTLVAKSSSRPRFVKAVKSSKKPKKVGDKFTKTGDGLWSLGLPIDDSYSARTYWKVGIKTGKTVHVIKIRVVD